MKRSPVYLLPLCLLLWSCPNPFDSSDSADNTNIQDTVTHTPEDTSHTADTTDTSGNVDTSGTGDTTTAADTTDTAGTAFPLEGTWIVHQHNIDFLGDEWEKDVIRYYQLDIASQWFLVITHDTVTSYRNVLDSTFSRESYPFRIDDKNRLLFYNGAKLVDTRLPVYYDNFGDTISYVKRPEEGYWSLEAVFQDDIDYLKETIFIRKYTGTVPPPSWNDD